MKNRAYRYLTLGLLGFALLVALPVSAQDLSPGSNRSAALDLASLTKAACHGNVSCQPTYGACAGWSGYFDCGDPWCDYVSPDCGEWVCDEWYICFWNQRPLWVRPLERYRVCFDPYGNSCTEWQTVSNGSCGCE